MQLRAAQEARHAQRLRILDDTLLARNSGSTLAAPAIQLSQSDAPSPSDLLAAEKQRQLIAEQQKMNDEMRAIEAKYRGDIKGLGDAMTQWRVDNAARLNAVDRLAEEATRAGVGARPSKANLAPNPASGGTTPATKALADAMQQNARDLQELQKQTKDLSPEAKTAAFAAWRAKSTEILAQYERNVDEERLRRAKTPKAAGSAKVGAIP